MQMLKNLYGSALPARIQLDKQILSKCAPYPALCLSMRCTHPCSQGLRSKPGLVMCLSLLHLHLSTHYMHTTQGNRVLF